LYAIDNRLRNKKHVQTKYFGNIDMVLCGDCYQEKLVQDSLFFYHPMINMKTSAYDFWKQNIKLYELQTTMRDRDEKIIAILNKM
jgi:hypothetical protein